MTVQKTPNNFSKYSFLVIVLLSVLVLTYAVKNPWVQDQKQLTYSEFLDNVENKAISKVILVNHGSRIKGTLKDGGEFYTDAPEDKDLISKLREAGIPFSAENPGVKENITSFLTVIIVPAAVILVFWLLIMRQAQVGGSQAMSFGRSRAKLLTDNLPKVTFNDVAGVDEAKEELVEIVDFLKDPARFQSLGAKIPKGVLMVGAPGTGKTLLARAIAGEAGVPFLHMSGSDFVEMFVGVGASRVRDLFEQAKKNAPCLVFVDEIDAVGRQRGAGLGGGHDEREQTLNQLLVEMDGFDANIGVILIAATNRPDVLDPALLRPGRFDRRIIVDRPDLNGRREILEVHARGKPLDPSVDFEVVARRTPGFTGADLENVLNEAAILAARENFDTIYMHHLEEAIDRVIAGPERKSRVLSDKEKKNTAYHEAGHALVAKLLPESDPVHKISILPRGMALGYTLQLPLEDKYSKLESELLNNISVLLGGRVAERIMFGEISTGAANDLERATKIARRMVCEFGMSERLGPLTFGKKEDTVFLGRDLAHERDYSESVAGEIDQEIRRIVDECYVKVKNLLEKYKDRLILVADKLIEHESLEGVLLETLLDGKDLPPEEIEKIEQERQEENERRREEKLRKDREKQAEKDNDDDISDTALADATTPPGAAAKMYMKTEQSTISGSGNALAEDEDEKPQVAAAVSVPDEPVTVEAPLLGKINTLLEDIFSDKFEQQLKTNGMSPALEKLDTASSADGLNEELDDIVKTAPDLISGIGLRLKAAVIAARKSDFGIAAEILMAALHGNTDTLDTKSRSIMISAISYYRIASEEFRKAGMDQGTLSDNPELSAAIDKKFSDWEDRASKASNSFYPIS